MATLLGWMVHLYTASSAAFGLWAVVASFHHDFRLAMGLMLLTLVIDSTDGALARALAVRERIPGLDGRRLDDICDYVTYVLVPACFLIEAGLLPHPAWAAVPVLASAYGFSQAEAKTDDCFFLGWPSYWNVVAIYLYLLALPASASLGILLVLAAAIFVPLRWVYPSRTPRLRPLTLAVLATWITGFTWLALHPAPDRRWVTLSLVGPAYYVALSLLLNRPRERSGAGLH